MGGESDRTVNDRIRAGSDDGLTFVDVDGSYWRAIEVAAQDRDHPGGMGLRWFDGPNGAQKRFAADSEISNPPTIKQLRAMLASSADVEH